MNVLFVPMGGRSHQIPLYVLYKRYFSQRPNTFCAFLMPAVDHKYFKVQNINVIDLDYQFPLSADFSLSLENSLTLFKKEREAICKFRPDLIIEDLSIGTAVLCKMFNIPRISIQRTGFFRSSNPLFRNPNHIHSMEKDITFSRVLNVLSFKKANTYDIQKIDLTDEEYYIPKVNGLESFDIINSRAKIIPGISSLEKLPDLKDKKSYFYSGPLNVKDNPSENFKKLFKEFCDQNKSRKKIFITLGIVEKQDVAEIVRYLLKKEYAIITTIPVEEKLRENGKIFFNPLLPLNLVCSEADLVIHQCGSGMYHYALLNTKPTITLGTQCYDREEIALELESLGVSAHTPSPLDDSEYFEKFKNNFEKFEKGNLCDFDKLEQIRDEILTTMLNFNIEKVINYTTT